MGLFWSSYRPQPAFKLAICNVTSSHCWCISITWEKLSPFVALRQKKSNCNLFRETQHSKEVTFQESWDTTVVEHFSMSHWFGYWHMSYLRQQPSLAERSTWRTCSWSDERNSIVTFHCCFGMSKKRLAFFLQTLSMPYKSQMTVTFFDSVLWHRHPQSQQKTILYINVMLSGIQDPGQQKWFHLWL